MQTLRENAVSPINEKKLLRTNAESKRVRVYPSKDIKKHKFNNDKPTTMTKPDDIGRFASTAWRRVTSNVISQHPTEAATAAENRSLKPYDNTLLKEQFSRLLQWDGDGLLSVVLYTGLTIWKNAVTFFKQLPSRRCSWRHRFVTATEMYSHHFTSSSSSSDAVIQGRI